MTLNRGVLFVGGAALLAAWFAAAADSGPQENAAPTGAATALDRAESVAREIESQASRLHARLADALAPSTSGRNPFSFELPKSRAPRRAEMSAAESPAAIDVPEPLPLTLSGIAEDNGVRIAVLSGLGDVFLVRAGETILSRYEVVAVGADAAELKDLTTGYTIRLGLR